MIKWLMFSTISILLVMAGQALQTTAASAPTLDPTSATVKIVRTWQRSDGQAVYEVTEESLGTVIAPNLILTHDHFGIPFGARAPGLLALGDNAQHSWRWRATAAQLMAINAGTGLIRLPNDLPVPAAPLAGDTDLQRLTAGSWLTVTYGDDNTQHLVQRNFQVIQVKDGIARLADPDRVIQAGDSGGGAYFNGKLIGNIWSINLDGAQRAAGSFNVALLPSQAQTYVK